MLSKSATIHNKPIPQEFKILSNDSSEKNIINDLETGQCDNDDFDVEISHYQPPCTFSEFLYKPFAWMDDFQSIECKTGRLKLPKKIIDKYSNQHRWKFDNYHYVELAALLYLHYYRDCDEWKDSELLKNEVDSIIESLPHFKTIDELFTYSFMNGDIKLGDFDQVIEVDESGASDVTYLAEDS